MDKALHKLYWACRRGEGFPGHPPDVEKNILTTNDILEALGLIASGMNELQPEASCNMSNGTRNDPPNTQPTETTMSLPSPADSECATTSPVLLPRLVMKERQPDLSSDTALPKSAPPSYTALQERIEAGSKDILPRGASETGLKINSTLDSTGIPDHICFNAQPTFVCISDVETANFPRYPSSITGDNFLPPWPGSLEAAYQASQIGYQN